MRRSSTLVKVAVGLVVLAGFGFFFVRSARNTLAQPYTIERNHLRGWTVTLEPASNPTEPMLVLQSPPELGSSLFRQVFVRSMESLHASSPATMPLLLKSEFDRAFAGRATVDALVATARNAGLDSAAMEPRCLAYRRVSEPGVRRQVYFVVFDAPAFGRFREQIGALVDGPASQSAFDPAALSPVLIIGASDPAFHRWLPLRANPESDCVAPITVN